MRNCICLRSLRQLEHTVRYRTFNTTPSGGILPTQALSMEPNVNTLERAFELARSGKCVSIKEIRDCLHAAGYGHQLVVGRYLAAQLRQLMREANPKSYGFRTRAPSAIWPSQTE